MAAAFRTAVKHCGWCNKQLKLNNSRDLARKKFCSMACRQRYRYAAGDGVAALARGQRTAATRYKGVHRAPKFQRTCEFCAVTYQPKSPKQRWCSVCVPHAQARAIMRRYGINWPQYQRMLDDQDGLCAICRRNNATCVDHDHACCDSELTCGQCVRGLLCNRCNVVVGLIEHGSVLLVQITNYLDRGSTCLS